jgi:predicted amidohydrolase YtcJ
MRFAGVSLCEAIEMATITPALLVHHPVTRLEVGASANLVLFDLDVDEHGRAIGGLSVRGTVLNGECVYGGVTN